jgi:tyrosyl-tRNA synthetase
MMLRSKLAPSRNEARNLVKQGGISVCDEKVTDPNFSIAKEDFANNDIVIRKGKKIFHRFTV